MGRAYRGRLAYSRSRGPRRRARRGRCRGRRGQSAGVARPPRRPAAFAARPHTAAGPPPPAYPPRLRVDGGGPAADEAAERNAAVRGEVDGEARRRADGDEDRTAGDRGLLDELEREPAAYAEHVPGKRQQLLAVG